MKNDRLVPGIILVMIGAAILLANYGYLNFHLDNIFRLWPIFLVIAGVNLILAHNRSPWSTILRIAVVVCGVGLLLFGNFGERYDFWPGHHWSFHSNDDNDDDGDDDANSSKVTGTGNFNVVYAADVKTAQLILSGDATGYKIVDTTTQLFDAEAQNKNDRYVFSKGMEDSIYTIEFRMKDHNLHFGPGKNTSIIRLNANPEWLINVKTDVAGIDFDLSKNKVKQLQFDGDVSGVKVKMGMPLALTDIEINSDMSGVDISVPNNAAYSIESDADLSGDNFDESNLHKIDDNHYETNGYAAAKTKFHIHVSGDLSGFNVKTY